MRLQTASRRRFLQTVLTAGPFFTRNLLLPHTFPDQDTDEQICARKFSFAVDRSLQKLPIGEVMVGIGRTFEGTPYVANTLEVPGEERLVINLQGLDCVSFVENALTLSRCVKLGKTTFEDYKKELQHIRYRDGIIDKYPSRLHYFSDWIHDNERKHVVKEMTHDLGGIIYPKKMSFMTQHRSSYRQLVNDAFFHALQQTEEDLATRTLSYLPKESLAEHADGIANGDILALTTPIDGLDVGHTGLAIRVDGVLRFLHAPMEGSRVQVTELPLVEYLLAKKRHTGIMVARPLEPMTG